MALPTEQSPLDYNVLTTPCHPRKPGHVMLLWGTVSVYTMISNALSRFHGCKSLQSGLNRPIQRQKAYKLGVYDAYLAMKASKME